MSEELISALRSIVGDSGLKTGGDETTPFLTDWHGQYQGRSLAVVMPDTTEQVSQVMALADRHDIAVVPQGGNTGFVGGATPDAQGNSILLSLRRMNQIREIDTTNMSMTVEAGCILQTLQEASEAQNLYFPLNLAAKGSCTIGGNLGTNAGGLNVIKYGNVRDLCLGLEAVLPCGQIVSTMKPLKKNNMGFDLKNLLIGSEGTLGIITSTILKTFPIPKDPISIFLSINNLANVLFVFELISREFSERILAFELIKMTGIDFIEETGFTIKNPFNKKTNWKVLIEIDVNIGPINLGEIIENTFYDLLLENKIVEVFFATNINQRNEFWKIRELIPAANRKKGSICSNDISVPIEKIPEFIKKLDNSIYLFSKDVLINCFGHIGDGNLHYNLFPRSENARIELEKNRKKLLNIINELVNKYSGSISAEHGIGRSKIKELYKFEDPGKLYMMKLIKNVVDPKNILNPGTIFY